MVVNVAIAIQAAGLMEAKSDALGYIFRECRRIANEMYRTQWKSYEVYFALDAENQTIKAYTRSDHFHEGKKPIFTIERKEVDNE